MSESTSKAESPPFPAVVHINGRGYIWRSELEAYKAALVRYALGGQPEPPPKPRPEGDSLVPLRVVSGELGICRRSVGRRIAESQTASGSSESRAA
jgi:hypothetical protein